MPDPFGFGRPPPLSGHSAWDNDAANKNIWKNDLAESEPLVDLYDRPGKLGQIQADYVRFEEDLHKFLQWVFGPRGVRSLRLFHYGDFSFDGRFKDHCRIICRNETPEEQEQEQDGDGGRETEPRLYYREVTKEDRDVLNLLEEEHDFVTACPVDTLFGAQKPNRS
ncbi:hypothetical protein PG985_007945 [Apiospora marii]|uniref:uncharacterized protein n=1 Tax=Apiospora marii TaxID=335849 RepID=UPI003130571E